MRELGWFVFAALFWIFALWQPEVSLTPVGAAPALYSLAALSMLAIVSIPRARNIPLWWLAASAPPIVLGLKWQLGYPLFGTAAIVTVTEIGTLALTLGLARAVARVLRTSRDASRASALERSADSSAAVRAAQRETHQELRRARRYQRPAALVAFVPADEAAKAGDQKNALRMARLMTRELRKCDVVVPRGEYIVGLLPETSRVGAGHVVSRLRASAAEQLDLPLRAGIASFPDEEVTFVGMMERAVAEIRSADSKPARRHRQHQLRA